MNRGEKMESNIPDYRVWKLKNGKWIPNGLPRNARVLLGEQNKCPSSCPNLHDEALAGIIYGSKYCLLPLNGETIITTKDGNIEKCPIGKW